VTFHRGRQGGPVRPVAGRTAVEGRRAARDLGLEGEEIGAPAPQRLPHPVDRVACEGQAPLRKAGSEIPAGDRGDADFRRVAPESLAGSAADRVHAHTSRTPQPIRAPHIVDGGLAVGHGFP